MTFARDNAQNTYSDRRRVLDIGRIHMSASIYVGDVSLETTANDLIQAFRRFGGVRRARISCDPETGMSQGFGFVEMRDGAEAAVANMHGATFQGRILTVKKARVCEVRPLANAHSRPQIGYSRRCF